MAVVLRFYIFYDIFWIFTFKFAFILHELHVIRSTFLMNSNSLIEILFLDDVIVSFYLRSFY